MNTADTLEEFRLIRVLISPRSVPLDDPVLVVATIVRSLGLREVGPLRLRTDGDELDVLVLLESLVEQSPILTEPDREGLRYRMLEPVRQLAREARG